MHLPALFTRALSFATLGAAAHSPASSAPHLDLARRSSHLEPRATNCPALSSKGPIMGAYVPAWTNGAVEAVDWGTLDVAFWFTALTTSGGLALAPGTTIASMKTFTANAVAAGKIPMLTVGGWSGSVYFSDLVSTSTKRAAFANTIKTWLRVYGFKGVDLDWEFVGRQGAGSNIVSSADSANYLAFLSKLRSTLGTDVYISAAVPAAGINGPTGAILADTSKFAAYLDFIQLMTYDFYGSWSATTGPNSPLYTCDAGSDSVDGAVKRWVASGFPACKIVLGVPAYSQRWKTLKTYLTTTRFNGAATTAFQALATSGQPDNLGWTTKQLVSEKLLSADLKTGQSGYTRYFDECTKTPFLFNPAGNRKLFVTYEDDESWAAKGAYAKAKGLAGVAVYESTGPTASMWASLATSLGHASSGKVRMRSKRATTFGEPPIDDKAGYDGEQVEDELRAMEQLLKSDEGWEGWSQIEHHDLQVLLD
ncbi:hypothetical protein JCM10450v2_006404 [Rhodotorula kratochvilovae]